MKNKILILILLVVISVGCKKFLTINPTTTLTENTFFKTAQDFQSAINGAYAPLRGIYNSNAWRVEEMHSDNTHYMRFPLYGAVDNDENLADFNIPVSKGSTTFNITSNTRVRDLYRGEYQVISRVNQILSLIDDADIDQDIKDNVKGQALFLRALSYFDLARLFGGVPLHLTPVSNRFEAALPITPVDSIFIQIESDAQEAIGLLPVKSVQELGRATKGAARTVLADAYINQRKWDLAEPILHDVIQGGEYQLIDDYADVFSESASNKNNAESVFEIQYKEGTDGYSNNFFIQFIPKPILVSEITPILGVTNPQAPDNEAFNIPTPDIINAYEPGDKRKDASIAWVTLSTAPQVQTSFPYIKKYAKKHALYGNAGMDWPVYRYAEVLLMYAEVLNEQNKPGEAAHYLDEVRHRAGLKDSPASGQTEMRDAIFNERRVELAFENKRWFDIARTDRIQEIIVPFGQRLKANPVDYWYPKGFNAPPNAFSVLDKYFPLPADESAISPYF